MGRSPVTGLTSAEFTGGVAVAAPQRASGPSAVEIAWQCELPPVLPVTPLVNIPRRHSLPDRLGRRHAVSFSVDQPAGHHLEVELEVPDMEEDAQDMVRRRSAGRSGRRGNDSCRAAPASAGGRNRTWSMLGRRASYYGRLREQLLGVDVHHADRIPDSGGGLCLEYLMSRR